MNITVFLIYKLSWSPNNKVYTLFQISELIFCQMDGWYLIYNTIDQPNKPVFMLNL